MLSELKYRDIYDLEKDSPLPEVDSLSDEAYRNARISYIKGVNHKQDQSPKQVPPKDGSYEISGQEEKQLEVSHRWEGTLESANMNISELRPDSNIKMRPLRAIADAHEGWVRSCVVDPVTNSWFASGSADSTIKIWNLASSKLKATLTGHVLGVRSLVVSDRHPYLFSGSEDKSVRCWDLERTNSPLGCQIREYHGHVGGIYAMALHPALDVLFTGGRDSVIRVWDIRSRVEAMVLTGHRSDISSIVSQIGDPQIISSSMDSTIRLWDLRKATTALTLAQHSKSVRLMIMHPQEMTICSADATGDIKEWVIPSGDLLNDFGTKNGIINTLALNDTNNLLFAGYDDGKMEFYDYISGELILSTHSTPMSGSESPIYASTFDYLGLRMITCEGDKSIKIWGM